MQAIPFEFMDEETIKIKYFLYARKSSESEDRQMASIDSQITEMESLAEKNGLEIVKVFSESKSAKAPGRPVFNEMIDEIHKGQANGIICWKLNRLARNPIDGGQISWMLQQGVIQHIQTYGKSYYPNDNVIMIAVELGMANQFVRDLSIDAKRGKKTKAEKGWYPSYSTVGYINNIFKKKGEKEIIKDPDRFDLIRKTFDLMLTGQYNPPQILEIATNQWGLKNKNGKKIARSTMYRIFSDTFYYGEYEYPKKSGNWYHGEHPPMITKDEFDRIQFLLGRRGNPRAKIHNFTFRGPIKCGGCGAMITAEKKMKRQKNGNVHSYVYYHCTKRKDPNCTQLCIEEKELEKQIVEVLERIEIPPEFHQWAINCLKELNKNEIKSREQILVNQRKEYDGVLRQIDGLIDMRANKELTEDEFKRRKTSLTQEKERLSLLLGDTDQRVNNWLDLAEKYFAFAENAKTIFEDENSSLETKKGILYTLGSDLSLKDKKLSVLLPEPLVMIEKSAKEVRAIHERLEPLKDFENKKDLGEIYSQSPMLLAWRDAFRTYDWPKALPCPELVIRQVKELLALV